MTECTRFREQLDDVAAGAAAHDALRVHLATCEACAAALSRKRALLEQIDGATRTWMAVAPSTDFADRVMARVRAEGTGRARYPSFARVLQVLQAPSFARVVAAAAAAGVAAAAIAVVSLYEIGRHAPIAALPSAPPAVTILDWQSPTAMLAQPIDSVLDVRARGHLLDMPRQHRGASGGNHDTT